MFSDRVRREWWLSSLPRNSRSNFWGKTRNPSRWSTRGHRLETRFLWLSSPLINSFLKESKAVNTHTHTQRKKKCTKYIRDTAQQARGTEKLLVQFRPNGGRITHLERRDVGLPLRRRSPIKGQLSHSHRALLPDLFTFGQLSGFFFHICPALASSQNTCTTSFQDGF